MTRFATAIAIGLLAASPAAGQIVAPDPEPPVKIPEPPAELPDPSERDAADRAEALDGLFAALAEAGESEWEPLQQQIMARWARSPSPSMTLLLARATRAMEREDFETALAFLDDLVRLAPDFPEAWNRRATLHFLREDYGRSLADIQRTLALEPRHFGAMAGLGIILDRLDREAEALRVYRRALEIHPHLEGAKEAVERLTLEVEGRPL